MLVSAPSSWGEYALTSSLIRHSRASFFLHDTVYEVATKRSTARSQLILLAALLSVPGYYARPPNSERNAQAIPNPRIREFAVVQLYVSKLNPLHNAPIISVI